MNKGIILIFVISFFVFSCKKTANTTPSDCLVLEVDMSNIKDPEFKDIFKSIELIPLETSDSILVGGFERGGSFYVSGKFYALIDKVGVINIFDNNGRFLSSSKKCIGGGGKEYNQLQDAIYNQENNTIDILDFAQNITSYNLDFSFVSKKRINIKAKDAFRQMFALNASQYILFNYTEKGKGVLYDLKEDKEIKEILYPGLIADNTAITEPFTSSNGTIYFSPPEVNDYVFTLDKNKIELMPRYKVNIGQSGVNKDDLKRFKTTQETSKYLLLESDKYTIYSRLQNEKYVVSTYIKKQQLYFNVYNIHNGSSKTFKRKKSPERKLPLFFAIDGDELLSIVAAFEINDYIDEELVVNKRDLHMVDTDDNPIIVRYKLK